MGAGIVIGGILSGLLLGWSIAPTLEIYDIPDTLKSRVVVGRVVSHDAPARTVRLKEKSPSRLVLEFTYDDRTPWSVLQGNPAGKSGTEVHSFSPSDLREDAAIRVRLDWEEPTFHARGVTIHSL